MTEEVVGEVVREVQWKLAKRAAARLGETELATLGREVHQLRREILKLGEAIVSTDEAPHALVRMIREREERLAAVEERSATLNGTPTVVDLDAQRLEEEGRVRLADLHVLAWRNCEEARRALAVILRAPLGIIAKAVSPRTRRRRRC